jgi:hypothetical protein
MSLHKIYKPDHIIGKEKIITAASLYEKDLFKESSYDSAKLEYENQAEIPT